MAVKLTKEFTQLEKSAVKLTVTIEGAGEALIEGLPVGTTYEVIEQETTGWRQVGEIVYSDTIRTIAAGDEDTATITNEEIVSIKAKKNWADGKTPYPGTEVELTLSATVPGVVESTSQPASAFSTQVVRMSSILQMGRNSMDCCVITINLLISKLIRMSVPSVWSRTKRK